MADCAVADARQLIEAAAGFHAHAADALVLEHRPALEHVDELHVAVVPVPLPVRRLAWASADYVRHHLAARRAPDAEVAILEIVAQAPLGELGLRAVAHGKPGLHRPSAMDQSRNMINEIPAARARGNPRAAPPGCRRSPYRRGSSVPRSRARCG